MTSIDHDNRAAAIDAILARAPVLPVLAIERLDDAVPLARALVDGGLPVLEVTLRTPAALAAITRIAAEVGGAVVGAGTVLSPADLDAVAAAGAAFAISPGATQALYTAAAGQRMPWIPAISTASELMRGLDHGHRRFKFFPAEAAGGVAALNAFAGPFPQARFCPTGGIDATSALRYRALPNVMTVGGSWMVPREAIEARDWQRITALARACCATQPL
ncbi:MAG: bifunctional 4-hydroxy-2-oxoglutarate aldolase/2-dehydro-3-deoxy-phosphogluconate aldolase [Lysobacter sp.]|nr:bifunctional 4-hydroxy-2-oxoglutarate aldolase/2-dehydro-3-deoxy-phosphogluconate aldolase [Lysobacter sp.]MDV5980113.1 bifunctional 4-hydroxy-2-oxoglutarate aldolase/2-dehydro-3-deoxy-phosphogluconate aldolase [Lysobacter sp.]